MPIETSEDIDARLETLYGIVDWRAQTGLLHVAAIESALRRVLIPGSAAPPSETDRFVLGFARARAEALISTGAILRAEPDLVHTYAEDVRAQRAFEVWRAERLGLAAPPELILLSASGDFPQDHPALRAAERGVVWTTPAGADRLGERAGSLDVRASDSAAGVLGEVVGWLRRQQRARTILVEAGPTAADAMYCGGSHEAPTKASASGSAGKNRRHVVRCDELLLSRFESAPSADALGPPFISADRLQQHFGPPKSAWPSTRTGSAGEGAWRFERYRAEPVGDPNSRSGNPG